MKRLRFSLKTLLGYTLAEIVIVMLVIAVIVAVTIGVTKHKMDNIINYTYYSAYSTLREATAQILADYAPDDTRYQAKSTENTLIAKVQNFFISNFGGLAVMADNSFHNPTGPGVDNTTGTVQTGDNEDDLYQNGNPELVPGGIDHGAVQPSDCTGGRVWTGSACVCPEGTVWDGTLCKSSGDDHEDCTGGKIWNGSECVCPEGTVWDGTQCKENSSGEDPETGGSGCTGTAPCGKQCDTATGTWVDIPGFSRECDASQNKVWSETQCACISSSRAITLNGQKYCEYLVSLLNTKANASECTGNSISTSLTDFSGKIADITLRNGMRMYNVRQNPQLIPDLENNNEGGKVVLNGVEVDTNKWGYTVYIDVDGQKGASEKWVDVYPFYVTLSGMVIPAYDKDNPGLYGADSRNHMQVSIEDEIILGGHRTIKWLAKSVSYKEAACGAGYVGANTPYCRDAGAISINSECASSNSLCRLKYVRPFKLLF